jgi:hypothetical protein
MLNSFLRPFGLKISRTANPALSRAFGPVDEDVSEIQHSTYSQDGLQTNHNHDFMRQPNFGRAYERGVKAVGQDYNWHWRVHVGLWAASAAAKLPGDFVECGVNRGFLSSAIMQYLDWNTQDRLFFLLDTFSGLDLRYVTEEELQKGAVDKNATAIESGFYTVDIEPVRRNFAEWKNVVIVPGAIPETLAQITSERIAFASVDMNCSPPEVAAMEHLWDRLVPGAMVVLDDYAYAGYRTQKVAMDRFARTKGVSVLSLPTGQGLLIRPPH